MPGSLQVQTGKGFRQRERGGPWIGQRVDKVDKETCRRGRSYEGPTAHHLTEKGELASSQKHVCNMPLCCALRRELPMTDGAGSGLNSIAIAVLAVL